MDIPEIFFKNLFKKRYLRDFPEISQRCLRDFPEISQRYLKIPKAMSSYPRGRDSRCDWAMS
jgi:hypothetical protein